MVDFAQKLMTAAQMWSNDELPLTPNQRLNTTGNIQKSTFRIGLWPITSSTEPEIGTGMGIGLVLATLLEQWPSVCVYRIVTQVSGTPSDYQWKIENTQFGVDDWEIEGLDENVAIWGSFVLQSDQIKLSLQIEDDAREDDSVLELNYESVTLGELLNQLPRIATRIMNWLENSSSDLQSPYEVITAVDSELIKNFLEDSFLWELDYFLELWGQGSDAEQVLRSENNLIEISNDLGNNFGAWLTSQSISRYILFNQTNWSEWLLPTMKEVASSLDKYPIAAVTLSSSLFRLNDNLEAFDTLETSLSLHPEYRESWIVLGDMYGKSSEVLSAIDVYQRAIEANAATAEIYLRYAGVMDSLFEHQIELNEGVSRVSAAGRPYIERYIFSDSTADRPSLRESCAAYRQAVKLEPLNIDALAHLVIGLLVLNDPDAWAFCVQLIDNDKEGAHTASVIEQLADTDLADMIDILETATARKPQELSIHLNLGRAYLAAGQDEKAKSELGKISISDLPYQVQSPTAHLRLSADEPDFEVRLRELQDILDARGQVSSKDIEFLEAAIEKEALFSEGYRLLAQSYLSWNEPDDALEVLLDGQKKAPFDAELIALLANVLWDADEPDLAFAYLDQGLNHNGQNATLLSLMGRFLFDNGEDDSAKEYLRRAETVDPLNSELSTTRSYIANVLIKSKKT